MDTVTSVTSMGTRLRSVDPRKDQISNFIKHQILAGRTNSLYQYVQHVEMTNML